MEHSSCSILKTDIVIPSLKLPSFESLDTTFAEIKSRDRFFSIYYYIAHILSLSLLSNFIINIVIMNPSLSPTWKSKDSAVGTSIDSSDNDRNEDSPCTENQMKNDTEKIMEDLDTRDNLLDETSADSCSSSDCVTPYEQNYSEVEDKDCVVIKLEQGESIIHPSNPFYEECKGVNKRCIDDTEEDEDFNTKRTKVDVTDSVDSDAGVCKSQALIAKDCVSATGLSDSQAHIANINVRDITLWLKHFQSWNSTEMLFALENLISICQQDQVRHMMKIIEPQFQRDFISLLPKEVALYVLSFLEPKYLVQAAQTCSYWRDLSDDCMLWRKKCEEVNIKADLVESISKKCRRQGLSPWKVAFLRQHKIEMNWRVNPVKASKILKGHDDHVITCLQFCGNRIVSGSDDNTLKVWSVSTGKCLRTLVGHTGGVWSSQMAGNIIISGSTDRTLKVWNAETGNCIHTLYGHTSTVRCMHLHGNIVVSGSRDATLRVWDVERGICLHILVGHLAAVRCVQFDGRLIVSGAYDYTIKVWDPETETCLHTLTGHSNRVYSLQFDGVHVVSGSLDTTIKVWDVVTGELKHTLTGHQSLTSGMELRNNILVSGNADSTVKVWDIVTGRCLQTLSGAHKHQSAVTCLQFNSQFVITSSDDGTVKLWDVKTGLFIRDLVALESGGSGGVVWRIRASDTKLVCAVGSRNGTEETKLMVLDFDAEPKP